MRGLRLTASISGICAGAVVAMLAPGAAQATTIVGVQNDAASAQALVTSILGPGITLAPGSITLTGVNNQQGTFTNGAGSIGIPSGIVLTSGNANNLNGSNAGAGAETLGAANGTNTWSLDLGTGGDAALDALAGFPTFDANILTFSFQFGDGSIGGNLFFNFVFASEEYIDFVGTDFNDVFAFLVDGVNVATIGGNPITINNINPNVNSTFYVNNVDNTNGFANANRAVAVDGFTTVIIAQRLGLGPGTHTMSFRIADTSMESLTPQCSSKAEAFLRRTPFRNLPPGCSRWPASQRWSFAGCGSDAPELRLIR